MHRVMEEFASTCIGTLGYSVLVWVSWQLGKAAKERCNPVWGACGVAAIWGGGAGLFVADTLGGMAGQAVACAVIAYHGHRNANLRAVRGIGREG